jgi:general secretion pathway protein G
MRQRIAAIRERRGTDSGFTLIELLVTVIILGVLAGVVVFAVGQFNSDGVAAACKADAKNVEIAYEAMYAKTGTKPATIAAMVPAYLKEAPSTAKYTITLNADGTATGAVNGGGAC